MGFGDQHVAAKARDLITSIAEGVVNRMRPEARLGKVFDIDTHTRQATVLFAGESYPDVTYVKYGPNLIPTTSMLQNGWDVLGNDAPGDIVRVVGSPGRYYIDGFVTGNPVSLINVTPSDPIDPLNGQVYYDESTGIFKMWSDNMGAPQPLYTPGTIVRVGGTSINSTNGLGTATEVLRISYTFPAEANRKYRVTANCHPQVTDTAGSYSAARIKYSTTAAGTVGTGVKSAVKDHRIINRPEQLHLEGEFDYPGLTGDDLTVKLTMYCSATGQDVAASWGPTDLVVDKVM